MTEFKSIKCPIFVVIGSNEQYATKPLKEHVSLLKNATGSKHFSWAIIKGADHGFNNREKRLAGLVIKWAAGLEE